MTAHTCSAWAGSLGCRACAGGPLPTLCGACGEPFDRLVKVSGKAAACYCPACRVHPQDVRVDPRNAPRRWQTWRGRVDSLDAVAARRAARRHPPAMPKTNRLARIHAVKLPSRRRRDPDDLNPPASAATTRPLANREFFLLSGSVLDVLIEDAVRAAVQQDAFERDMVRKMRALPTSRAINQQDSQLQEVLGRRQMQVTGIVRERAARVGRWLLSNLVDGTKLTPTERAALRRFL